ncbi:hypothetical protein TYRP_004486 [Tyrophagus putrescentiae]|nr:hypothetical protein TYRP_004486 [Tyrophagus putrescentiae]
MAQIYVSQSSPPPLSSSPTPLPPPSPPSPHPPNTSTTEFYGGPILQYLKRLQCKLPTYESALNETAIEKELYATENETPSMDLLTCSSALTNGSAGGNNNNSSSSSSNLKSGSATAVHHYHSNRSKLESSSGLQWSCTGKYNPSLGLGPLEELFSGVRAEEVVDAADHFSGQLVKHSFPMHSYESCTPQQHPTQLEQIGSVHSRVQSAAFHLAHHHHGSPAISQAVQSTAEPAAYSCHPAFSRDYGGLALLPPPSAATASYDASDNYSYGYSQAELFTDGNGYPLTTPFAQLTSTATQLYSTPNSEEWYSIPQAVTIVDGLATKYTDNMDVHRLSGYSDYPSLNQASAGHYY